MGENEIEKTKNLIHLGQSIGLKNVTEKEIARKINLT